MRLFPSASLAALALAVIVALSACSGGGRGDAPPGDAPLADEAARSADGFIAVESGYFSSCGLRNDGSLVCWGITEFEPDPDGAAQYAPPPQGEVFTALSSGAYHACALREDGSPVCWGALGVLTPPEGERFAQISVGSHACGLREDGSPVCWSPSHPEGLFGESASPDGASAGADASADIEDASWAPPEGERFASISVGGLYACGLRRDGSPVCWGEQLDDFVGPMTPPIGARFTAISVGDFNACGLRLDGSLICWTADIPDAEGLPPVADRRAWAPWEADDASSPEVGQRFADISVGSGYACALREDGSPVCWNFSGDRLPPFGQTWPPDGRFVSVSASFFHACGLREDGPPTCWGSLLPHYDGGQAAPPGGDRLQTALPADQRFIAVSNASDYACAIREDGAPVCAGSDSYSYYAPPEGEMLAAVSVSETLGCGLRENGSLVCWPDFGDFERIWGDYVDYLPRAAPPPEGVFTAVSVGESQACALREDGSPACWALLEAPEDVDAAPPGWDSGTTGMPPAGERFASVSVGEWQACGLRLDGSPVCWPLDDSVAAQTTPAPSNEAFTAISGGRSHACALRADGSPVCWGADAQSQTSPPTGAAFTAISSGDNGSCGLRENGTLACWGSTFATSNGRVERGAGSEFWPPRADERFIAVSVGGQRVCAIRADGSPVCWGGSIPS